MKKSFLLASALIAFPLSTSFAIAQNSSRAYLNVTSPVPNDVGAFAGPVKDSKGIQLGSISQTGDILDGAGDLIGKVDVKGKVVDATGNQLGVVAPADKFGAYNLAKKASMSN